MCRITRSPVVCKPHVLKSGTYCVALHKSLNYKRILRQTIPKEGHVSLATPNSLHTGRIHTWTHEHCINCLFNSIAVICLRLITLWCMKGFWNDLTEMYRRTKQNCNREITCNDQQKETTEDLTCMHFLSSIRRTHTVICTLRVAGWRPTSNHFRLPWDSLTCTGCDFLCKRGLQLTRRSERRRTFSFLALEASAFNIELPHFFIHVALLEWNLTLNSDAAPNLLFGSWNFQTWAVCVCVCACVRARVRVLENRSNQGKGVPRVRKLRPMR